MFGIVVETSSSLKNVGGVKHFLSTQLGALEEERQARPEKTTHRMAKVPRTNVMASSHIFLKIQTLSIW
jgi:hypothetical protein